MKLSILIPVYKEAKLLSKFIAKMNEQTSKDFQLVFVMDTNKEKTLSVVDGPSQSKCKLIYNSSRSGRAEGIKDAISEATGSYSIIMSTSDTFKKTFVADAIKLLEKQNSDIVEFQAKMKEPIKFVGKIRHSVPKETNFWEKPEIIAYSYFFDFNKFFKTSVLKKIIHLPENAISNSRYSVDITTKAFSVAKTYSNTNKTFVTSKRDISQSFNPLKLVREWESIIRTVKSKPVLQLFADEVSYACYSHIAVFLFAFTGVTKNKILAKKLPVNFKKLMEKEMSTFFESNKYIMKNTAEAKFLHMKSSPQTMMKLYKEFK